MPFYLVKFYGKELRKYFDPDVQRTIDTTVWDEVEKRALSEVDRELKEASTAPASMTWFSLEPGLQLGKMNLNSEESSEDNIDIQIDERSEVSTFVSKAADKGYKKKSQKVEEGEEDDVSDLTTKSQETKVTKLQENITDIEGKLAASIKENADLQKQLKETMAELARRKLSSESLVSQGVISNTSTLSSNSSHRSRNSKRNRENKTFPQAKRPLLKDKVEGTHTQGEPTEKIIEETPGKVTRSGRIIGPFNDGSKPGEAKVSPGTT